MLKEHEIEEILKKTGAMLKGHFLLSSGKHSDQYFQCAKVLQHPEYCEMLCRELAKALKEKGITEIQAVVAPAIGGILVSYELARALKTRGLFTERENGVMTLRRGFSINAGEKILVAEDVITTGGSVKEVIDAVKNLGGDVVGVAAIINRSGGKADLSVPIVALINTDTAVYEPEECPLCAQGLPAVKPGSRKL
jgi:orotate phosphoribosyltransferase